MVQHGVNAPANDAPPFPVQETHIHPPNDDEEKKTVVLARVAVSMSISATHTLRQHPPTPYSTHLPALNSPARVAPHAQ